MQRFPILPNRYPALFPRIVEGLLLEIYTNEVTTVYHALLASCWTVCDSMLNLEASFGKAIDQLNSETIATLHSIAIEGYKDSMIAALPAMLTAGQWEDVSRMFRLLSRVSLQKSMEGITQQHIKDVGANMVEAFENPHSVATSARGMAMVARRAIYNNR